MMGETPAGRSSFRVANRRPALAQQIDGFRERG